MDRELPEAARRQLLPHEEPVLAVRQHAVVLARPFAVLMAAFMVAGVLTGFTGSALALGLSWAVCLAVLVWLVFRVVTWSNTYLVATPTRVMFITGFMAHKAVYLPLNKMCTYGRRQRYILRRPPNYGEFHAGTRAADYAIKAKYMPRPGQIMDRVERLSHEASHRSAAAEAHRQDRTRRRLAG